MRRTRLGEMKAVLPRKLEDAGCTGTLPKLNKKLAARIFRATKICR